MKKTFTINISGTVFHIDEDAHEKLNNYLTKITRHFGNDADAKEIEQDIEARISELFSQRIKSGSEVITIEHVDEIIQIMGMPEDFDDKKEENVTSARPLTYGRARKLYRDPDDRILGGVCSGLGAYFNIDRIIVRLIFIALVFLGAGSSVLIYLILWIVVPKAKSIAQRLEMKGEQVNVNSISKSIKEEIHDVKESYDKFRQSKTYSTGRDGINAGLKILLIVIGAFMVITSVVLIFAFIISLFLPHEFSGMQPFNYLHFIVSNGVLSWFWFGLSLVIGIPLILLTYIGLRLIFHFKSINGAIGLSLAGLWIFGILILIISTLSGVKEYKVASSNTKQEILSTRSDTLYLQLGKDEFDDFLEEKFDLGQVRIATMNDNEVLVGIPRFTIEPSESSDYSLVIKTKARGTNLQKAQANAKEILYKYEPKDSLVTFNPWFVIPSQSSWHAQNMEVTLKVPLNKTVYLGENMEKIIYDIKNTSNTYDDDMVGKYWTMKPEGLELAQRKPVPLDNNPKSKK